MPWSKNGRKKLQFLSTHYINVFENIHYGNKKLRTLIDFLKKTEIGQKSTILNVTKSC